MKKTLKRMLCSVLCMIMLLSLFACNTQPEEDTSSDETQDPGVFVLTPENLSQYRIIVSDNLSKTLNEAALLLRGYIKNSVGVEPDIKSDIVVQGSDIYVETEYEIILGDADRAEIEQVYKDLRTKDYGYAMVDKKIILIGTTADLAKKSVDLFYRDVLIKAKNGETNLLYSGENKITAGNYTHALATIGGVSIGKYVVVYPNNPKNGEKDVAEELCRWVELNTGYVIKCISDNKSKSEYEINIGNTTRITAEMISDMESKVVSEEHFYVSQASNMLWATGSTANTLRRAVYELTESFNENGELNLDNAVCKKLEQLNMTVMSYNVRGVSDGDVRNSENVISSIRSKSPDVFALQEATAATEAPSAKWISRMKSAFGTQYDVVLGLGVGKFTSHQPIYYKKDKFELVASGCKYLTNTPDEKSMLEGQSEYYRIVNFAVLRDKESGMEFVYSNNHFDISGYKVRVTEATILATLLKDYPLLPVICSGDFNASRNASDIIETLMKKTKLSCGSDIAETSRLINSSTVNEDYKTLKGDVIDYVFVSAQNIKVKFYEIWDNKTGGSYPSDHLPIYLELSVNY